jgi:16S rRNA (cytosine967-C5)-methyltransferase
MSKRHLPGREAKKPKRHLREDLVLTACLEAYALVRREGRLADRALEFTLRRKPHLYSQERRAASERVYGLLRRQLTVDFLLQDADEKDATRLDVLRFCALRVLEGEAPEAVSRSAGLLLPEQQLLSRMAKRQEELSKLPPLTRLSLTESLPPFLAERFLEEFGEAAFRAAAAMNVRAPLTARVNTLKTSREQLWARLRDEGAPSEETPYSPLGLSLKTHLNAFSLPAFREGLFELQDEGSQLLGMLVDAFPGRIVDACAGAGGKALQLAAQMKNRGELFAFDVDEARLDELRKRARRDGVHNVRARAIPPAGPSAEASLAPLAEKADRVLVDAPCSGSGTLRRKPDARYRMDAEQVRAHALRQMQLLTQFSVLVKPGGWLVYGTCSILSEENHKVVSSFLDGRGGEFSVLPVSEVLGPALSEKLGAKEFLRLLPHLHNTDGFFGAVLRRRG